MYGGEVLAGFCLGDLSEGDAGIDGRMIILKCFFSKSVMGKFGLDCSRSG